MNYIVLVLSLFLGMGQLISQTCNVTISGKLIDNHSQKEISFAKIFISNQEPKTVTDASGGFVLNDVCPGKIVLALIPCADCDTTYSTFVVSKDTVIEIFAESHVLSIHELTVSAYRFRKETQSRMSIKTNDLSTIQGNTLGDQLLRVPGVTTLNTGTMIVKPVINGMSGNRIVIMNNEIRQEGQQWGSEHAPEIDPNLMTKLEVIQGANGLRYGPEAIGGVVLTSPEDFNYQKPTNGWLKLNGTSNGLGGGVSALVQGSILKSGNLAFRASGSARIIGTQHAPNYLIKNTASDEQSFSFGLGFRDSLFEIDAFYSQFNTNIGIFTGSHIGNLSDLNQAFSATSPKDTGVFTYDIERPKQRINHHLTKIKALYKWSNKITSSVVYGYQYNLRQEYDLHKAYNDSIAALDRPAFELNLWTHTLDLNTEIRHTEFLSSTFGISGIQQSNAYQGRFFIPNFKKMQLGAFYIVEFERKTWHFDFGARYDWSQLSAFMYKNDVLKNPINNFQNVSGSLGVSKSIGRKVITSLHVATGWRPPSINELYSNGLHHGAAAIEVGDTNLRKEIVTHLQLNVQYKMKIVQLEFIGFYNYFDGYINLTPNATPQLTIAGAFPKFEYVQSDVNLVGFNGEATVSFLKYWNYRIQGSVLYANDIQARTPVFGIPSNRISQFLKVKYPFGDGPWEVFGEVSVNFVAEQKRFTPNLDYVNPPGAYYLVNAQVGFVRNTKNDNKLQFVLSCTNIANSSYRDYMNRFRYFTDEIGRNWNLKMLIPFNFNNNKKQQS